MRRTMGILALGVALAACGDDDKPAADTATPDTTADVGDTAGPDTNGDTGSPADTTPDTAADTGTPSDAADTSDTSEPIDTSGPAELAIAKGDRCDALTAVVAPALPFSDSGDTAGASDDYIYTTGAACGGSAGQGLWGDASPDLVYAFTPDLSGTYRIEVTPDGAFDPGVMVTDACPPIGEDGFGALTCLGVSDQGEGAPEVLRVELVAGRNYYVLVDGWSNDTPVVGTFALSIALGEDCDDGADNDGNAAIDCADVQCADDPRCDEAGYDEGCGNDVDDDQDGQTDCADSDCDGADACNEAAVDGACDNDLDDEGDGRTDCADPDCAAAPTCDESAYEGGCDNGLDDEADGKIDCDDPDCGRATACLAIGEVCETASALELGVPAQGTTIGRTSDYGTDAASCNLSLSSTFSDSFGLAAPDAVFRFTPPAPGKYLFLTSGDFDDGLTVTSDCTFAGGVCYGVERDGSGGERLVVDLPTTDPVFVIVDGWSNSSSTNAGDFTLVALRATATNSELDCTDGNDGDGDGDVDCADVDCAFDRSACVESGRCDDGLDNDGDEDVDCDDADCRTDLVACPPPPGDTCATPANIAAVAETLTIDTCDFASDYMFAEDAGCSLPTYDSPDGVIGFVAPADGQYVVEVDSPDMDAIVNVIVAESCPATAVTACDGTDDAFGVQRVSLALGAGERAWFIVSAYGDDWFEEPGCGEAAVTVYEVEPEVCDDDLDNDRDGDLDCDDADCDEAAPCNEARNGPQACGDGADNDGDGVSDCWDIDCAGSVQCPNGIPGDSCASPLAASGEVWTTTVDTCLYTNHFTAPEADGCQATSSSSTPKDFVVSFTAPAAGDYRVALDTGVEGTSSFDSLLNVVKSTTCPTSPLSTCVAGADAGDPEVAIFTAAQGETFWIVGGGWASGCGRATVAISLLAPEVCDDAADNDGDGKTDCADVECAAFAACIERCDDKIDNDVDGRADCADTDCVASPFCNEAANGAGACGDEVDNDLDGLTDCYDGDCKADAQCPQGAIGDTCAGAVEVDAAPWSQTFGTCSYTSDFSQSSVGGCRTMGSAGDVVAHFVAPADGQYRVTYTTGLGGTSAFDSVLNVVEGEACPAAPIAACLLGADNTVTSPPSETVTIVATAGASYWILADGYGSGCGLASLSIVQLEDEVCDDAVDNDGDGTTDCQDVDCRRTEPGLCPTPEGDLCGDDAIAITALPFADDSRSTCDFAKDYEADDETCWGYSGAEVVYRYTATAAATLEVSVQATETDSGGDLIDMVLSTRASCPAADVLDQCTDSEDSEYDLAEVMQIPVTAGETVYIFAASYYGSDCTQYRLEVRAVP